MELSCKDNVSSGKVFSLSTSWNNAHDDPRRDDCSHDFTWDTGSACRQAKITTETCDSWILRFFRADLL